MAPKREHKPGDITVPPVWDGKLTFSPSMEPVGAGDGDTYVVRACGRCSEVHAEIAKLQRLLDERDQFIVRHDLWGEFVDSLRGPQTDGGDDGRI